MIVVAGKIVPVGKMESGNTRGLSPRLKECNSATYGSYS